MRLAILNIFFFLITTPFLHAQQLSNSDYAAYISKYKSIAIREMQLYKIPASITLAQGMIESGCGKSILSTESKNHFGIKCQKDWTGERYFYDDDEANECFRKYNTIEESYRDHSLFLSTRQRYASLFALPLTDYKGWAKGLKQAGYATNPEYANMLIRAIENNQLYLLDDTLLSENEEIVSVKQFPEKVPKQYEKEKTGSQEYTSKSGNILFRSDYTFPEQKEYEYIYTSELGRKVYQNCGVPFIFVKQGDTWFGIAREFGIYGFQVFKQNDLLEADPVISGQMLYLEPKKKRNMERSYTVKKGDCLYSISQEKCIKLAVLLKLNKYTPGKEPEPGEVLKLSK